MLEGVGVGSEGEEEEVEAQTAKGVEVDESAGRRRRSIDGRCRSWYRWLRLAVHSRGSVA